MEVTIRLMMVLVISVIVVLFIIMIIFNVGGDAVNGLMGFFDWIKGMIPESTTK
jgi:hypothetical protein